MKLVAGAPGIAIPRGERAIEMRVAANGGRQDDFPAGVQRSAPGYFAVSEAVVPTSTMVSPST